MANTAHAKHKLRRPSPDAEPRQRPIFLEPHWEKIKRRTEQELRAARRKEKKR